MSEQIEGRNAVLESFRSGKCVDKLFILDGCQDGPVRTIAREARKKDTIINYVAKERLDQLSETGAHQGVIAQVAAYEYASVEDILAKAKEKGYVCVAAGAADDWVNSDWFVQISNEFEEGAVYEAEKGERPWTDQCFVDTMTAWQNLFNDGIFEDGALGVATYPDARDQYFFARKSVFFLTGSWHLGPTSPSNSEIQGTEIGNQGDTIGMCVFPSMSEDGKICGTAGVDTMVAVNKDCKEKEAAMKFVQFMADGDGQQYWVNYLQGAPVSKNISYTGTVDGELQQQSIDEVNSYVSNAVGNRKLSNSEVETAIQVAMQNVAAGADPADELKTVQDVQDAQ